MRVLSIFIMLLFPSLAWSQITFDKKEIEITASADQETVTFVFPFKNTGKELVEVIDVNLTCSCLSAKTDKDFYAPSDKGKLEAIFLKLNLVYSVVFVYPYTINMEASFCKVKLIFELF